MALVMVLSKGKLSEGRARDCNELMLVILYEAREGERER